jgi:RHS repeat-associated protein
MGTGGASGYDHNGNILKLQRNGKKTGSTYGLMDDMAYTYTGNQLTRVDDAIVKDTNEEGFKETTKVANEYLYNANGNMAKDQNKDITSIAYNHLNLAVQVNKGATDYIVYTYDAAGRKLSQQVFGTQPKTTDYAGEFVYENNTVAFVAHEEGRIVADNSAGAPRPWEYQYFLKDHLGNVRVTFSEKTTTNAYTATLENATQTNEQNDFKGYKNRSALSIFNKTAGGTYSQVLNGGNNNQIGLAKSFAVNPGDVVDVEAYAKYEAATSTTTNLTTLFTALAGTFALSSTGGTGVDGVQAYNAFNGLFGAGAYIGTGTPYEDYAAPKAYLNYILFDENFVLKDFGYDQISNSAAQVGVSPVTPHDYLSLHVKVQQKGYLYIYVSNENPTVQNVYFDDLKISYTTGVEQVSNYYAFGLTFNSYSRENSVPNQYKYNSKELQDELNLNVYDYGHRMYDPALGRFWQVDPLADFFPGINPYSFAFDNPISYNDPDGLAPMWFLKLRANLKQTWYNVTGRGNIQASITGHHGRTLAGERKSVKVYAGKDGQAPAPKPHAQKAADNYGKKDTGGGTPEEPLNEGPFETEPEAYPEPEPEAYPEPEKKDPEYKGRTIQENKSISFSENIVFGVNSSAIPNTSQNNKVISDLVKVLTDYPQLQLLILGNAGTDKPGQVRFYGNSTQALNQGGMVNGRWTTFGSLMTSRAQAMYNALIKSGIDPSRLTFGPGNLLPTPDGRRTSFVLRN